MVSAPTGDVIPAKMTEQPDGRYQLEYSAKIAGKTNYYYFLCCYHCYWYYYCHHHH